MPPVELFIILFFIIYCLIAFLYFLVGWWIAYYKNRNKLRWGVIVSMTGIVGAILILSLPKKKGDQNDRK